MPPIADAARPGAEQALRDDYDDVAYTSAPEPSRHPERLATLGTLHGIAVAPLAACRVLELACGDGANLVSIASTLPAATFVGFDFAPAPIARARRMAGELGLANVRLLELDLRDVPADLGTFDYILAHGLYSWIPAQVRVHVMPLIARHLAPNGLALVSFNAMPGCHLRGVVWDMLKYHTRDVLPKSAQVSAARALLALVGAPVDGDTAAQQAMRAEVRQAAGGSDASMAHDELSDPNHPFYFHEFAADAAAAGLTFMAEARAGVGGVDGIASAVRDALAGMDRLAREQYLDFIHFRHFRESLLCHAGALTRFAIDPARALDMHATPSLLLRRVAAMAAGTPAPALDALERRLIAHWPASMPVAALLDDRHPSGDPARAGSAGPRTAPAAGSGLQRVIDLFQAGRLDLRTGAVAVAVTAGERPEAFAAARWLNHEHEIIPSLYHEPLRYHDPLGRRLLARLDGTRTREALGAELGGPFAAPAGRARLDRALAILASKALLLR